VLQITPGERTALEFLANDKPIAEIADGLGVRVGEVGARLASLFLRMGVTGEVEAVAAASRRGLLKAGDETMATTTTPVPRGRRRTARFSPSTILAPSKSRGILPGVVGIQIDMDT
jgi:DNA-binding CsgD family transcriptional regulator